MKTTVPFSDVVVEGGTDLAYQLYSLDTRLTNTMISHEYGLALGAISIKATPTSPMDFDSEAGRSTHSDINSTRHHFLLQLSAILVCMALDILFLDGLLKLPSLYFTSYACGLRTWCCCGEDANLKLKYDYVGQKDSSRMVMLRLRHFQTFETSHF